ncbi:hypothetical protein [Paraconexibacter algicola]|uniref:hypothetical protein n=1 Tax=Paraconexibacter algicola TaxID=2133960 RepID=UPI0011B1FE80|nr:hypothetical protein [Paraconexibacter algicola]
MIDRCKANLSYANVMATFAVFVALGGSSYAAITLPRNSVGDKQIRTAAVRSSEVRDRSLGVRDLSLDARKSLRGVAGPAGPAGTQGPAGQSATAFFAVVAPSGSFVRGNASSGGKAGGFGSYNVVFPTPVSGCGFAATLASTDGSPTQGGRVTVADSGSGGVAVQTFDAAGTAADLGFHLLVAC